MALFATLGSLKVWSANSCARFAASRCPRRSTKRPRASASPYTSLGTPRNARARNAKQEIWPTIFSIVAPCTALSFHLPRRRSLAHTPKTLQRARAVPYSLSHAARLPASSVNFLGNVLAADEIGGDALRAPSLIFSNCLAKFSDHRLMKEMCHEKALLFRLRVSCLRCIRT
jgi:hypothetical protein